MTAVGFGASRIEFEPPAIGVYQDGVACQKIKTDHALRRRVWRRPVRKNDARMVFKLQAPDADFPQKIGWQGLRARKPQNAYGAAIGRLEILAFRKIGEDGGDRGAGIDDEIVGAVVIDARIDGYPALIIEPIRNPLDGIVI